MDWTKSVDWWYERALTHFKYRHEEWYLKMHDEDFDPHRAFLRAKKEVKRNRSRIDRSVRYYLSKYATTGVERPVSYFGNRHKFLKQQ